MLTRSLLIASILSIPALAAAEPRVVIATDPLALLQQQYTLSATYALGHHVALHGEFAVGGQAPEAPDGGRYLRGSVGVQLFLDHTYHGPFLEPGLLVMRTPFYAAVDQAGDLGVIEDKFNIMPQMLVGWQWLYHDRYSFAVAVGGARAPTPPYALGGPTYFSESYLRVGYAF